MNKWVAAATGIGLLVVNSTAQVSATGRPARFEIALHSMGGSHVSGTALVVYNAAHHTTTVTLHLHGLTAGIHFAHIHIGRCGGNGSVKTGLAPMQVGRSGTATSVTTIPSQVTGSALHINIHGVPGQPLKVVACGNL